jgi:membrane fusion protein, multidrug efflux system
LERRKDLNPLPLAGALVRTIRFSKWAIDWKKAVAMTRHAKVLILVSAISTLFVVSACTEAPRKNVALPPDVTVTQPVQRDVTRYLEYTGTTAALESVDIRARVPGFLQKIQFQPRAKVKARDPLFVIDPRQYEAAVKQAEAKLKAQKASSKLAQTELKINQQLESKEAISGLKLEKKAAERDVADADVELAEAELENARLKLEWCYATSPIDGRVSRNLVDAGNLVGEAEKTLLTTVVNDESIYAYFNVSEADLLPILRRRVGEVGRSSQEIPPVPVYLGLADETGYPHEGHLDFADTKVTSQTGTIQVRGIFDNPDGLLMPGLFVRVRVPVEKRVGLLVPDAAVQFDQGGRYVLVATDDNVVQQKRVKIGQQLEGLRVIDDGLTPKDRVIISGVQRARPGAKVSPSTAPVAAPQSETPMQGKSQDKQTGR